MNPAEPCPGSSTPCRHLRNKGMYYTAMGEEQNEFEGGECWCAKAQENFGPDGEAATKTDCCAGRTCYVA